MRARFRPFARHFGPILALGLPLIGSHVAQFAINLTDTVMLGWYDVQALAAQVLAGSAFFVIFIVGAGFAWAVMPLVATAEASGDAQAVRRTTRMGLWLSALYGILALPLFAFSAPIFRALGQEPEIAEAAALYLWIAGPGILPALGVMVLKSYLSALERARIVLLATLAAVAANALGNWILIFGRLGLPELGLAGAAWSSVITQLVAMGFLVVYAARVMPEHALFRRLWRIDTEAFATVFRLGWPIGLTNLAETGLFSASALMMGWLGALPLAAHGIALNITATVFMVHVGLSNVATIRAGQAMGRGDHAGLREGALAVIAVSALVAAATVVMFLTVPEQLVGLFVAPGDPDRPAILAIGATLLAAAALFQFADAAQVVALGLLRGVQDTRVPMLWATFSYWGVGVPASYLLAFHTALGGVGIWLGLALGLGLAGAGMMARFWLGLARRGS
ncbi:multidrug resistance protein, MATE family [Meinhardsimonia xiamenensis]|jgi:MATE family multidrug resistance protein|uniref:Multidrug-efflux transporter n=1 Tax=Meinhardsimonia xiamenensis TaxID=990712 RepID=A0A1G9FKQ1_9RHOB|nr:MATE family efflux transporter [Meinhardsimonia xiamenensis]PRX37797.1 MATE family multidrug resistance protein [Meinhardsimonia xiamenensis]SDK88925.1 multidrug resistance protein, MATE family [Meinhardsimonia xiamenensis]